MQSLALTTLLASFAALAVVWIAYPGAVWLLSRPVRRRRLVPASTPPLVSVVVASREPPEALRARVENCWDTEYDRDRLEVLAVVDAAVSVSEPAYHETLAGCCRLVAGDPPGGKAAALNAGVRAARGSVLVFADTWQRFEPATIPRLVAALESPGVGAVSGALQLPDERSSLPGLYWRYERWLRECEARLRSSVGVTGAVYAVRRELWPELPEGLLLDDVFVPMQILLRGHRIDFEPAARAFEVRRTKTDAEFRRKRRTLTGVLQLCTLLPGVLVPRRNPVWLQFVCHKLLRLATPLLLVTMMVSAAMLLVREVLTSGPVVVVALLPVVAWFGWSRSHVAGVVRRAALDLVMIQAAALGALYNALRRRWGVWNA